MASARGKAASDGEPPKRRKVRGKKAAKATVQRHRGPTKADQAVDEGKQTPTGAGVSKAATAIEIYASWCKGIDPATLAARHNLSQRRVQEIVDDLRAESIDRMDLLHPLAGIASIDRDLVQIEHSISVAAQVVEAAFDDQNWNAVIGATRLVAELRSKRLALQQSRGIVPKRLADLHDQWDAIHLVDAILGILERYGVPDEVGDALAQLINLRATKERGRLELVSAKSEPEPGEVVSGTVVG